jgi:AraC-like DNA-binding protein
MRPVAAVPDPKELWNIAVPQRRLVLPGVAMAGFDHRPSVGPVDLRPLPLPAVTLVLDIGEHPVVVDDVAVGARRRGSLVVPLAPGPIRAHGSGFHCMQVRLSPLLAQSVLGAPAAALDGAVVELADLWGDAAARRLEDALRATTSWERRFEIVDTALARRHVAQPGPPAEVAHAWQQILDARGQLTIEHLAAGTGWSRKRLWSRFRDLVGIGPKRAAMLARFDYAAHRLAAGVGPAQVAAESGYVDQSHLNREVRSFTGATPTAVADAPWLAVDDIAWPGPSGVR